MVGKFTVFQRTHISFFFFFPGFNTLFPSWLIKQCRIASVSLMMTFLLLSVSFLLLWVLMERRNVFEEVHLSIQIPRSSIHGFQHCCLDSRWQWATLLSPYCWEGPQDWKCNYPTYMLNCHHKDSHITDAKWVARTEETKVRQSQDVTWTSIKPFLRTPDDYRMDDSMDKAGLSLSVLNVRGKKLHKLLWEQP